MKVLDKTIFFVVLVKILTVISSLIGTPAMAQTNGLVFGINAKTIFDDNIFREQEKESDTVFKFSPSISYKGLYRKHRVTAGYTGKYALFYDNSDVNFTDHEAKIQIDLSLTGKWSAQFGLQYFDKVEEAGINNSELNTASDFTKFESIRANSETAYGTNQSTGQVVLRYVKQSFNYLNNNQAFRDMISDDVTGTFFWRVALKSRLIFEVRFADITSENIIDFNQSFEQTSYLTGLTWDATAKTDGSFRIGYQDTQYDNPLTTDIDGLTYFVDINYRPDTDSIIKIVISRAARANAGLALANLETTDYSISWKNKMAHSMELNLDYRYQQDAFGGGLIRKNKTNRVNAELSYKAFNWLQVNSSIEYMSRDSDDVIYNFDNTTVSIGVEVVFD